MLKNDEIEKSKISIRLFDFFYILKSQDATIRSLFYTLFFKVVQYF